MAIFPKASLIMTAAAFFVVRKYFSETLTKNLSAGDIAMIVRMYPRLVQGSSNIHRYSFRSQNNYEKIYFYFTYNLHLHITF